MQLPQEKSGSIEDVELIKVHKSGVLFEAASNDTPLPDEAHKSAKLS